MFFIMSKLNIKLSLSDEKAECFSFETIKPSSSLLRHGDISFVDFQRVLSSSIEVNDCILKMKNMLEITFG